MKNTGFFVLFALLSFTVGLHAQSNMIGGENIVQQKEFKWKSVATDNFDVNFYSTDAVTATIAARYAEESLWEVCRLLDFKNRSRFALNIFLSPNDYIQSNMYPLRQTKEGGQTQLYANAKPWPVPLPTALVVKNGSKIRGWTFSGIPAPVS